jgi:hypothetical protein
MVNYPIIDTYLVIIIIFYLVLLTPSVSSLVGCNIKFVNNNTYIKQIFAFVILYFVIVAKDKDLTYSPLQKFFLCIPVFLIILIISKIEAPLIFSVIFILFIIYFLVLNREYYNIPGNENKTWISIDYPISIQLIPFKSNQNAFIHSIILVLFSIACLILLFGIVMFYGKISYFNPKKNINIFSIVFDRIIVCETPNYNYIKYFKRGLLTFFKFDIKMNNK